MRRIIVILTSMLMLAAMAVPASAKPDKPGKPDQGGGKPVPTVEFGWPDGSGPWAEYQPSNEACVADVPVSVTGATKDSRIVFTAKAATLLVSNEVTIPRLPGRSLGIIFSYDFPCDAEVELEVVHTAVLYDNNGAEVSSAEATHLMAFLVCSCEPDC